MSLLSPACGRDGCSEACHGELTVLVVDCAGINIGNIQNVMGVLYSATNFQGMFNLMNVLPVVGYERSVFYR